MGEYKEWKKLVRADVIPPLVARGIKVIWSTVIDFFGQDRFTREKVVEEALEVLKAKTRDELVGELADLTGWRNLLMSVHHISDEELAAAMADKDAKKGAPSFTYLHSTEEPDETPSGQH